MGKVTEISWCDHTFNPWWGCEKVSPACDRCYAWAMDKRFKPGGEKHWGPQAPRRFFGEKHWAEPLKWNRAAEREGVKRRVFCGSMCDVMEMFDPKDERYWDLNRHRERLWGLIRSTPHLTWMLLTKRPENYARYLPPNWLKEPRENVWLMTTVESQEYTSRIDEMLKVPAVQYGISAEPLLGPLDLRRYFALSRDSGKVDLISQSENPLKMWVIVGGETGPGARPSNPEWFRSVRDQCKAAAAPFFFKQWGEWAPSVNVSEELAESTNARYDDVVDCWRIGKKDAGCLLDGREWREFPHV